MLCSLRRHKYHIEALHITYRFSYCLPSSKPSHSGSISLLHIGRFFTGNMCSLVDDLMRIIEGSLLLAFVALSPFFSPCFCVDSRLPHPLDIYTFSFSSCNQTNKRAYKEAGLLHLGSSTTSNSKALLLQNTFCLIVLICVGKNMHEAWSP